MADVKLAIHIPPDSNPTNIQDMIRLLAKVPGRVYATVRELVDYLKEEGSNASDWVHSTGVSMGILLRSQDGVLLSQLGEGLAQVRSDARADLLHFLLYTGWSSQSPLTFLQSWSYRQCCLRYWREGQVELAVDYLEKQVAEMIADAPVVFAPYGQFTDVSFSRKSLTGAHNWLNALKPPVFERRAHFARRTFCPPELMALAIGYTLRDETDVTEYDILLTREKREEIAQICLIEPERFDPTLDWTISTFPHLIGPGTNAGSYGRFIRLKKRPTVLDIIR